MRQFAALHKHSDSNRRHYAPRYIGFRCVALFRSQTYRPSCSAAAALHTISCKLGNCKIVYDISLRRFTLTIRLVLDFTHFASLLGLSIDM